MGDLELLKGLIFDRSDDIDKEVEDILDTAISSLTLANLHLDETHLGQLTLRQLLTKPWLLQAQLAILIQRSFNFYTQPAKVYQPTYDQITANVTAASKVQSATGLYPIEFAGAGVNAKIPIIVWKVPTGKLWKVHAPSIIDGARAAGNASCELNVSPDDPGVAAANGDFDSGGATSRFYSGTWMTAVGLHVSGSQQSDAEFWQERIAVAGDYVWVVCTSDVAAADTLGIILRVDEYYYQGI